MNIEELQETNNGSRHPIIRKNAIIVSLVFIVILVVTDMFREQMMELNILFSILYMVILLAGIIVTQNQVRDQVMGGRMTFSKALGTGMLMVLWVTGIFVTFSLLFYLFITPETLTEAKEMAYNQMREEEMSAEEIEMAMKFSGFMFTPAGVTIMSGLTYLFFGFLLSLIGGAVTSRQK